MYKTSVTDEHAYQSNLKRSAKGENLPDSFPLNVAFSRTSTSHLGEEVNITIYGCNANSEMGVIFKPYRDMKGRDVISYTSNKKWSPQGMCSFRT